MLARIVAHLGHTAVACSDTAEAIEKHALGRFDAVFADYLMSPDDGIAVLGAFEHADAYRILLTASYATVEMGDALRRGTIHEVVAKPATIADLRLVLSHAEGR
jgi:CheY-like chemotaxis protein